MSQSQKIVIGGIMCMFGLMFSFAGLIPLALISGIIGGFLLLTGLIQYLR
jgi:hypothetical protein